MGRAQTVTAYRGTAVLEDDFQNQVPRLCTDVTTPLVLNNTEEAPRNTMSDEAARITSPSALGRRALLERAISMTVMPGDRDPTTAAARLNRSSSPATKSRWGHPRHQHGTTLAWSKEFQEPTISEETVRLKQMDSPPSDEMGYLESFEPMVPEELRVKICRDGISQNLSEAMRSCVGNTAVLDAIEQGMITAENGLDTFAGKSALEVDIALVWAAFLKKRDLLPVLLKAGANIHFCDQDGFSALHLAAFSGCVESCKFLISMGADINLMRGKYSPLHSAAFGNSFEVAQLLLNSGAKIEYHKNNVAGDGTALHSAVKSNAVECLRLLLPHCEDVNSIEPTGCSPLHLAADLGKIDCLRELVDWEGIDLNVQTRDKHATALHLAAENAFGECLALLLSKGADATIKNFRGQVPLHLAARAQSVECVETLLRNQSGDINVTDNDLRTPLHSAVGKALQAYEVVEVLVSWRADINAKDKYGYTALHIAALNELSQCVETLLYHGADVTSKTKGGVTALSIIVRKTPASLNMLYQKFDSAISLHDPEVSHREVKLKLDFRHLLQHCERGEVSYLKTFVDEGQKEILKHPLCEAFLHLKWGKIRKYYVVKLIFCFLFVLFLTLYVMSALAHNCLMSPTNSTETNQTTNATKPIGQNSSQSKTDEAAPKDLCAPEGVGYYLRKHPEIITVEWCVLSFFAICELFRKIFGLGGFCTVREYVTQIENILEWFVIFSVFAISFLYTGLTYPWQNHVGAFAVLFGWWNLMHMIGQLPLLGSYVAMYSKVQHEFLKLFAAYFCLLIGFTISFCVIFPAKDEFANPLIGFIKVLVMMTGELEFEELLIKKDINNSPFFLNISAHFIFIVFLLFVTVVLMNLLVGIAVHDIQGLQKTAGLLKLEQQTRLISYVELALFNGYVPRYFLKLLHWTVLVSPSAYRVVLHLKPLNPREKRLPKEILQSAYELAKQCKQKKYGGTIASRFSSATASTFTTAVGGSAFSDGTLYSRKSDNENMHNLCSEVEGGSRAIVKLSEEISELRELMEMQQTMMKELVEMVKKTKESDC